jgi:Kef-type K+ transport system membrane component KefB
MNYDSRMMEGNSDFLLAGILLALALRARRLASHWALPRVAAYLLVGMLFSPMIPGDPLGIQLGNWAERSALNGRSSVN